METIIFTLFFHSYFLNLHSINSTLQPLIKREIGGIFFTVFALFSPLCLGKNLFGNSIFKIGCWKSLVNTKGQFLELDLFVVLDLIKSRWFYLERQNKMTWCDPGVKFLIV